MERATRARNRGCECCGWFWVLGLSRGGLQHRAWARFQPESCKNSFTEQQEIAEGGKVAAEVFKQMPVLPDSAPVSQYVRQLGARLVSYAPGYKWPYNFHVVASEEINAFALPGGTMFVNLGTIQAAETGGTQLAGVMAHFQDPAHRGDAALDLRPQ